MINPSISKEELAVWQSNPNTRAMANAVIKEHEAVRCQLVKLAAKSADPDVRAQATVCIELEKLFKLFGGIIKE